MVKTGGSLFIALSLVVMLMPLLPLCIIFVRKASPTPLLNVLKILCLFVFLQHLVTTFLLPGTPFIQTVTRLTEFGLVLYLLKLTMTNKQAREVMNLFMVSFLSVIITIYSLKGITAFPKTIALLESFILVALAIVALAQQIGDRQIVLLNEPVFWIAGSIICYYGMTVFMEILTASSSGLTQQNQEEKIMVLVATDLIRFIFLAIAAWMAPAKEP